MPALYRIFPLNSAASILRFGRYLSTVSTLPAQHGYPLTENEIQYVISLPLSCSAGPNRKAVTKASFLHFSRRRLHYTPSNAPGVCELPPASASAPFYSPLYSLPTELRPPPPLSPQKAPTAAALPPALARAAQHHQKIHANRMRQLAVPPPHAPSPDQVRIVFLPSRPFTITTKGR